MEKNYCDLPQDLINIEHVAVVEPDSEKKSLLDKLFSGLYNHPVIVMVGVFGSGLVFVSVVVYFLVSQTSKQTASIDNLKKVSAQAQSQTKTNTKPVFDSLRGEDLSQDLPTPTPRGQGIGVPTGAPITQPTETPVLQDVSPTMSATEPPITYVPPAGDGSPAPTIVITQSTEQDTQPPFSIVMTPQNEGTITSKTDGRVCAFMSPPSDNVTSPEEIEVFYAFDSDAYASVKNSTYLCKETLPNGPHTLKYKSKDAAGNEEVDKSIVFTVNITGN